VLGRAKYILDVTLTKAGAQVDPDVATQLVHLYSAGRQGLEDGNDGGEKVVGDDDGVFVELGSPVWGRRGGELLVVDGAGVDGVCGGRGSCWGRGGERLVLDGCIFDRRCGVVAARVGGDGTCGGASGGDSQGCLCVGRSRGRRVVGLFWVLVGRVGGDAAVGAIRHRHGRLRWRGRQTARRSGADCDNEQVLRRAGRGRGKEGTEKEGVAECGRKANAAAQTGHTALKAAQARGGQGRGRGWWRRRLWWWWWLVVVW
jgi:hypothetical protein